jgi:DNA-directed RNA polymerase specialized sigma24 family protein
MTGHVNTPADPSRGGGGRDRDVISLKFSSGFSNQSIGRILGLREGHVAVILHRAVRSLRMDLEEEEKR